MGRMVLVTCSIGCLLGGVRRGGSGSPVLFSVLLPQYTCKWPQILLGHSVVTVGW